MRGYLSGEKKGLLKYELQNTDNDSPSIEVNLRNIKALSNPNSI